MNFINRGQVGVGGDEFHEIEKPIKINNTVAGFCSVNKMTHAREPYLQSLINAAIFQNAKIISKFILTKRGWNGVRSREIIARSGSLITL